jgi:Ring finger domain
MTIGGTFSDGDDLDDDSANVDMDTVDSQMNSSETTPMSNDKEAGAEAMNACCKDGSVCSICDKEYLEEEDIYESNNPRCGHVFHQACMERWLEIQNACPICTQPFVLRRTG